MQCEVWLAGRVEGGAEWVQVGPGPGRVETDVALPTNRQTKETRKLRNTGRDDVVSA